MNMQDLKQKLIDYMVDASPMFEAEGLQGDDSLDEAGLDSLDMVNFLLSIEENFNVKIEDEELADLNTLNDFAARVQSGLGSA